MIKSRKSTPKKYSIEVPVDFALPPKTQWGYMPPLWEHNFETGLAGHILPGTEIAPRVNLHHDADDLEIGIESHKSYSGISFDIRSFSGSFMSLAFGFPENDAKAIRRHDLIRIALQSTAAEPFQAFARLNLKHGPNTEQIVRMIDVGNGESFAEFDIFYTEFEPNRAADAWVDLIINDPKGRAFTLEQVIILRRVRATL